MERTAIIIPARLASTRFPAKPLAPLRGPDGVLRPALSYTWATGCAAARKLGPGTHCVVATDDVRIADYAKEAGMEVVMTPSECRNGTERCAAAIEALDDEFDTIINLQGDAPLTPIRFVEAAARRLSQDPDLSAATVAVAASQAVLRHLQADAAAGRVGGTTVVCDRDANALYFSKSIIPYVAPGAEPGGNILLHLGLYAYRPDSLQRYASMEPAPLEMQEGLEQLRLVESGLRVGVAVCDAPAWEMIELNNPSDVPLIERELAVRERHETI